MSIYIPIVSEFKSAGIDKAKKEFKSLEGVGAKTSFALKKAAVPAAVAIAGIGAALFDATKGAMEDAAAQELLAKAIKNNTVATDAQIKANEDWISTQGKLLGVADSELRPVIAKLSTQTGSLAEAQKGAALAMDIAAATGKPLSAVSDALAKAYGGNTKALAKLDPKLKDLIKGGLDAEGAMSVLADTFGGAATTKANTAEGQFKRLGIVLDETKESIGAALLPAIEAVLPIIGKFGTWASENTTVFLTLAGVIGGIATAIFVANGAMAAWGAITAITAALNTALAASFTAVQVASGLIVFTAIIAGLVLAYAKFKWFRDGVAAVFSFIGDGVKVWVNLLKKEFEILWGIFKALFNGIATLWNNTIGKVKISIPDIPGLPGRGKTFGVPDIPMLANGGIVMGPQLAVIGEKGPEAVIPLDRLGNMGGGNVTIHVNGGDPNAVVDALRKYYRQNGPLPVGVSY